MTIKNLFDQKMQYLLQISVTAIIFSLDRGSRHIFSSLTGIKEFNVALLNSF